eukprot:TRINITY_DN3227_c0_g1_i1.p2 TRINITY_DN3227_c0_g1~~TRINITY_DN3227_c0_g1_i1.p2  ORF type:complete len:292 (+),score=68.36 TRINITY_DN3227_c0_g1_i1:561-1436(+)
MGVNGTTPALLMHKNPSSPFMVSTQSTWGLLLLVRMKAGFDATKFPVIKKNAELLERIKTIYKDNEEPQEARLAKMNPLGKELLKKAMDYHSKLDEILASPKWSEHSKDASYTGYTMKGEEGFLCIRSAGVVPFTPIEALAYIQMDGHKQEYDEMYESTVSVEDFPDNLRVLVQKFKGKMFASPRDFLFLSHSILNPADGSIHITAGSVEDSRAPPTKSHVRGRLIIGGWVLKPVEGNKTLINYVTMVDLAGSLPTFIQNMAAKNQASLVKTFSLAFQKRFGKQLDSLIKY